MKIAVVQYRIKQYEPEKNLTKAESFIKKASEKADIVVFSEDFLTGGLTPKIIAGYADYNKKYRDSFINLAKENKIDIVTGSFIESNRNRFYNTSYYIDKTGRVKGRYRKVNLWHSERKHITPGNEISVFNTKYGKVGIIICWDLMFPEIFRRMISKGVKIVFCPSLWSRGKDFRPYQKHNPEAEKYHVNSLCRSRSIENNIVFVYVNATGSFIRSSGKEDEAIGQSQITVPIKGVLKKFDNEEGIFIQEVDMNILNDSEKAYKIRKDIKKKII